MRSAIALAQPKVYVVSLNVMQLALTNIITNNSTKVTSITRNLCHVKIKDVLNQVASTDHMCFR